MNFVTVSDKKNKSKKNKLTTRFKKRKKHKQKKNNKRSRKSVPASVSVCQSNSHKKVFLSVDPPSCTTPISIVIDSSLRKKNVKHYR